MRTFEYCTNCRAYKEFCEVDGVELCGTCGEPLKESPESDLTLGDWLGDDDE